MIRTTDKLITTKLGPAYLRQIAVNKYLIIYAEAVTANNFKAKHRHIVDGKRLKSILIKEVN